MKKNCNSGTFWEKKKKTLHCMQKMLNDSTRRCCKKLQICAVPRPATRPGQASLRGTASTLPWRMGWHFLAFTSARRVTGKVHLSANASLRGRCENAVLVHRRVITQGEMNLSGYFSLITDTLLHCGACWTAASHYFVNFFCRDAFFHISAKHWSIM